MLLDDNGNVITKEQAYQNYVKKTSESRGMSVEEVKKLAIVKEFLK